MSINPDDARMSNGDSDKGSMNEGKSESVVIEGTLLKIVTIHTFNIDCVHMTICILPYNY